MTGLPNFTCQVAGVTFVPDYPDNLYELQTLFWEKRALTNSSDEFPVVVLVRNPANEYDPNAVQIHVPALGNNGFVGHLPRNLAARLAPELDSGVEWQGWVTGVAINQDHEDRPGLTIELRRIT